MLKLKRVKQKTEGHAARERSNLFEMKSLRIDQYSMANYWAYWPWFQRKRFFSEKRKEHAEERH